jgi:hypothetical protein
VSRPELVAYEWISYWDEQEEKRFSDWPHAMECGRCGRKIVHAYRIRLPDGSMEVTGKECAWLALGWAKKNDLKLDRLVKEKMAEERAFKEAVKNWDREDTRASLPTVADAIEAARVRNKPWNEDRYYGPVVVFGKDGVGYYAFPPYDLHERALEAAGWTRLTFA